MAEDDAGQPDYDDGRQGGEWKSRYNRSAWYQICAEFVLLLVYLAAANLILLDAVLEAPDETAHEGFVYSNIFGVYVASESAKWIALAVAGFVGGTVFDFKWLYHSVAKGKWNRDRCLWRIIVPFNSAMVSMFTGFLFASEIVPFLKGDSFENTYALLGFGFVFGYFSDNILAALQNLAKQMFGTLKDTK